MVYLRPRPLRENGVFRRRWFPRLDLAPRPAREINSEVRDERCRRQRCFRERRCSARGAHTTTRSRPSPPAMKPTITGKKKKGSAAGASSGKGHAPGAGEKRRRETKPAADDDDMFMSVPSFENDGKELNLGGAGPAWKTYDWQGETSARENKRARDARAGSERADADAGRSKEKKKRSKEPVVNRVKPPRPEKKVKVDMRFGSEADKKKLADERFERAQGGEEAEVRRAQRRRRRARRRRRERSRAGHLREGPRPPPPRRREARARGGEASRGPTGEGLTGHSARETAACEAGGGHRRGGQRAREGWRRRREQKQKRQAQGAAREGANGARRGGCQGAGFETRRRHDRHAGEGRGGR